MLPKFRGVNAAISVRAAMEADAEMIARLAGELGYPVEIEAMHARLVKVLERGDHLVLVAQDGQGQLRGWLQAHVSDVLESGFRVEIMGLIVSGRMRRHGAGRLLVEAAERWAREVGARAIVVRSNVNRQESHAFYPALGYTNTKTQTVYRKAIS
jgi:GNAT superfamily N-acetyltransferase